MAGAPDKPVYGGRDGRRMDDLLDKVSELVRKRDDALKSLDLMQRMDPTLEPFCDDIRMRLL